jgi:hypothetical protein
MMKWFEYKEIGIGISINIDYIDSLSDIGFQSRNRLREPDFSLGICIGIGTN